MKRIAILISLAFVMAGCNLPNRQKQEAYQRWQSARAQVICSVGNEHLKIGDLEHAQARASEALQLDVKYLPAYLLSGKVLLEKGQFVEAANILKKAQPLGPRSPEVLYLLGTALEKRGDLTAALQAYQQACGLDEANNAYAIAVAEVMVTMGQPQEALGVLEGRLAKTDGDVQLLSLAGQVAALAEQPDKAVEFFQRGLDLKRDSIPLREELAKACFFASQFGTALDELSQLARHEAYKDKPAWLYIMIGDCQMALKRPREAKAAYEVATASEPGEAQAWVCLAKSAVALQDFARAGLAARRAMSLTEPAEPAAQSVRVAENSPWFQARLLLSYALLQQGDAERASGLLLEALRNCPSDAMARCMLGRCYARLGRNDQAVECYLQALQADPGHQLSKTLLAAAEDPKRDEPRLGQPDPAKGP